MWIGHVVSTPSTSDHRNTGAIVVLSPSASKYTLTFDVNKQGIEPRDIVFIKKHFQHFGMLINK